MIPALRQQFNANFTPDKYQRLLKVMEERCGAPVKFRVCETPVFLPRPLLDQMCEYGKELILKFIEEANKEFSTKDLLSKD